MFDIKSNHVCTITYNTSKSLLPTLTPKASKCQRLLRWLRKLILVAERNPQSIQNFRSAAEIISERKKQIESRSWIIHPFSTFRLYYEMWMALIFLLCLIYIPLDISFRNIMEDHSAFEIMLDAICLFDMFVTFRTGFLAPNREEVVMSPWAIAKRYVLSIFFISDLLSSIPEGLLKISVTQRTLEVSGLLKIVRSRTFIIYLSRTLFFFKVQSMFTQVVKLLLVIFLVSHYYACLVKIMPMVDDDHYEVAGGGKRKKETIFSAYCFNYYQGVSYLLGIDINLPPKMRWYCYIVIVLAYCVGKILVTFAIVVIVDMLKSKNSLENKYFTMMSQVDAYMIANKVPSVIQKRMREYYHYKYRQKYFKESSITKFISENLKKEINYHVCRKLVEGVKIFERLSQRILEDILTHLKVEIYLTGDVIIQAGSEGDCMYFLSSGTVKVTSPSGKEICHLEDGAYFGEIALVTSGQKRTANVVAIEICELYKLDRKSFKKCMEGNRDLHKKIQQEAKKRLAATHKVESRFIKDFAQII